MSASKIQFSTLYGWQESQESDAMRWVTRKSSDPKQLEAYRAGFQQGWGALRQSLILHGHLEVVERSR